MMKHFTLKLKILSFFLISIFQLNAQSWTKLGADIDGESANDLSGFSLDMNTDGNIVVIGSNSLSTYMGEAQVFEYDGSSWNQLGSNIPGVNLNLSVAINGDGTIIAIGAPQDNSNGKSVGGSAKVYSYNGTNWVQLGNTLYGTVNYDSYGTDVSLSSDGDYLAVSGVTTVYGATIPNHVEIYHFNGTDWVQVGSSLIGEALVDWFGYSIDLNTDGSTIAIGGKYNDGNGADSGHTRVYSYNGTDWTQVGADIDGEAAGDLSGCSVSINSDGTIIAIGALRNDGNGDTSGHTRIFSFNGTSWVQLGNDIDGETAGDFSGASVSLSADGNIVCIGAEFNQHNNPYPVKSGHARIFSFDRTDWVQKGNDIDGEAYNDHAGYKVALSSDGTITAISAPYNDGNGTDAGHVRVYTCENYSTIDVMSCETEYISPSGETWTTAGTYTDIIPNSMGCDSVITINLTFNEKTTSTITVSECDTYTSPSGETWTTSGTYEDIIPNSVGCDSIITINLTINKSYDLQEEETICAGDSYTFPDGTTQNNITSEVVHTSNLTTIAGCDSIIETTVHFNPSYHLTKEDEICSGESYTFPDGTTQNNLTDDVTHTSNLTTNTGCDSVIVTTVYVNPVYHLTEKFSICTGESYTFPDGTTQNNITSQVIHTSNLATKAGCDSIIVTTININPKYNLTEEATICSGESYTFPDGTTQDDITSDVEHTNNLLTEAGCDSIIVTTVHVNPTYHLTEEASICSGESYTFPDGTTQDNITSEISHTSNFLTEAGCDSIIVTTIYVNPVYHLEKDVNVCTGSSYTFPDGTTEDNLTSVVTHTSNLQTASGCDSIIVTTVFVNDFFDIKEQVSICSGGAYTFPDGTTQDNITNEMVYTSNLQTSGGCDSIIKTTVIVNPTYYLTVDTTICSGESYTFPDGTNQKNITDDINYTSNLQTASGCDSVITTRISVHSFDLTVTVNDIILTANENGCSYQWLDCNKNNSVITGATSQEFEAESTGTYSVILSNDVCIDTTICYEAVLTGISEISQANKIKIYPNPSNGMFSIYGDNIQHIEILGFDGKAIKEIEVTNEKVISIDLSTYAKGIYLIVTHTQTEKIIEKIIVE